MKNYSHLMNNTEITAGEKSSLVASNITNTKRFEIKTPDVVVHVDPERADLVETRVIDGRKCLVIPMEGEVGTERDPRTS